MHLLQKLSVIAVLSMGLSGCAGAAFIGRPVIGTTTLYAATSATEFINEQTRLGTKSGEGCVTSILGIVTTGDATATEAARKAGINRVTHIDHKFENILGLYAKYCVMVYGD
ncbi:TRL-like family protein [Archangium violaceum]|uniref:TRL-like family protein n=1 Tax=Archangium violaceum TaxID=83451 RepID=UPI00193C18F6|nr:TRL-like family protein [Archangium violaceum]QRK08325.1 TRL-like family protein [Archangium violaceum]